jgi:hypothetical protein
MLDQQQLECVEKLEREASALYLHHQHRAMINTKFDCVLTSSDATDILDLILSLAIILRGQKGSAPNAGDSVAPVVSAP